MDLRTIEQTNIFPREFRRIIESSEMTKVEIAEICCISKRRFYALVDPKEKTKITKQEFEAIRKFCINTKSKATVI